MINYLQVPVYMGFLYLGESNVSGAAVIKDSEDVEFDVKVYRGLLKIALVL